MMDEELGESAPDDEEAENNSPVDPHDPKKSAGWLAQIKLSEVAYNVWQDKSDRIDKLYASLDSLSSMVRDREFQLFWANIQVLGPSIYSRPPVPVVVPRFKDQKPLPRMASEVLERSCIVTFDTQDINGIMLLLRDDLNIVGRGAAWVRYETAQEGDGLGQRVCIEHKDRRDFLHDPAKKWADVDWVACAAHLSRAEMRDRFMKTSGDAYQTASYAVQQNQRTGEIERKLKAKVWEIWCKSKNRVYWVTEGVDVFLDEGAPHLTLEGFYPCPRPVYATVERGSLIPVPDFLFYKDQLEEINEYTARISALSESLRLKGFYPGGAGELSDAIEAAMKRQDDNQILIPVSNWALLGNGQAKDMLVWIPIDMVATTITELVALRKEVIQDVYQIMGLSDIMRGQTQASETLGAQQLKSQYGSVRIRDKQQELVRIARDLTRLTAEIMSENFTGQSLQDMSQMDLPTDADIAKQAAPLKQQMTGLGKQLQQAAKNPQMQQMAQAQPDQAKQIIDQIKQQAQQMQQQLQQLGETLTIDKVMKYLRDNRTRVFQLDIETDSTITPDEDAAKKRATEYMGAMAQLFGQIVPAVEQLPQAAPLAAEVIKWVNSQFRVGRQFEQAIETFTDQMKQMASQPKAPPGPTPEQIKAQADGQRAQMDAQQQQMDAQRAQADAQMAQSELQLKQTIAAADAQNKAAKIASDEKIKMATLEGVDAKSKLDSITRIVVARIANAPDVEGFTLEAQLAQELGIQEHQHALQQADQQHQHDMQMQAGQMAAAQQAQAADQQHATQTQMADQQHQQGMQADQNDANMEQQEPAQQANTEQEPPNGAAS